jgi:hypothetical protein
MAKASSAASNKGFFLRAGLAEAAYMLANTG